MCTTDDHNELKIDAVRLAEETDVGQPQENAHGVVVMYWRNCPGCDSSFGVDPEIEALARLLVEQMGRRLRRA